MRGYGLMRFYLGTHVASWLRETDIPLFISHRTLRDYKTLPRARGRWALDSGAFTELSMFGEWRMSVAEYAESVWRYQAEVGNLDWISPMDYMCEPFMLEKTGLTVEKHQQLTVQSYLDLLALELPVIPVLQGWELKDYERHVMMYDAAGLNLADLPLVGLGSVCRRQNTREIAEIVGYLHSFGIRLHGYGVKQGGLARYKQLLASADSMAWSFKARRSPPLPGCTTHINCANCRIYAEKWYSEITEELHG